MVRIYRCMVRQMHELDDAWFVYIDAWFDILFVQ